MEIAAGNCRILVGEDDRVVGDRSGLDGQGSCRIFEEVERSAHDLWLAAEAVGVLHAAAFDVADEDLTALKQAEDRSSDPDLPRLAAKGRDAGVEGLGAALQRVDGKSARGDCGR